MTVAIQHSVQAIQRFNRMYLLYCHHVQLSDTVKYFIVQLMHLII